MGKKRGIKTALSSITQEVSGRRLFLLGLARGTEGGLERCIAKNFTLKEKEEKKKEASSVRSRRYFPKP